MEPNTLEVWMQRVIWRIWKQRVRSAISQRRTRALCLEAQLPEAKLSVSRRCLILSSKKSTGKTIWSKLSRTPTKKRFGSSSRKDSRVHLVLVEVSSGRTCRTGSGWTSWTVALKNQERSKMRLCNLATRLGASQLARGSNRQRTRMCKSETSQKLAVAPALLT